MDLIDVLEQPGFRGMAPEISFRKGPGMKTLNITPERLVQISKDFISYIEGKIPIPDRFLGPVPGNEGVPRGELGKDVSNALRAMANNGCTDEKNDVLYIEDKDLIPENEMV